MNKFKNYTKIALPRTDCITPYDYPVRLHRTIQLHLKSTAWLQTYCTSQYAEYDEEKFEADTTQATENSQKENNNDKDTNSDSVSGSANNYNNGEY